MPGLYITLGVLGGAFVLYWIIIYFVFRYAFVRTGAKGIDLVIPEQFKGALNEGRRILEETPKQEVSIKSKDGLTLKAELVEGNTDVSVILFHGYRSGISDFAGAFKVYLKAGCNILLVHHRAHGKSEGKYITYGIKESEDCALWADFMDKRFGGKIYLGGISMGASTVLMSADKPLPPSVKGISGDCGFSSPYDIIAEVGKKSFHVPAFLMPMIMASLNLYCRIFGKFSLKNQGAVVSLKKATVPVALTHGASDTFVPAWMSERNRDACASPVCLYLVDNADHGLAYLYDEKGCFSALKSHFGEDFPL